MPFEIVEIHTDVSMEKVATQEVAMWLALCTIAAVDRDVKLTCVAWLGSSAL